MECPAQNNRGSRLHNCTPAHRDDSTRPSMLQIDPRGASGLDGSCGFAKRRAVELREATVASIGKVCVDNLSIKYNLHNEHAFDFFGTLN
jgi:hypothetical protein